MRWFVEITPLGAKPGTVTPLCVEAPQWKHALQKARALRGDDGALSNFSIDLLDDGYRAIDPIARLRYEVRRAPDGAPLSSTPTPPPVEAKPAASEKAAPEKAPATSKKNPLAQTVAFSSTGAAEIKEEPAPPVAKVEASKPAPEASKPAKSEAKKNPLAQTMAYGSLGEAVVAEASKPAAKAEAEPSKPAAKAEPVKAAFTLIGSREENPTEGSPLTYREQVLAVAEGTSEEEAKKIILDRFDHVRGTLDAARTGKLINIAVFDHVFHGKPQRRPLVTLAWKDWKNEPPELRYPAREALAARAATPSKAEPVKAEPVKAEPVKVEPVKAEPVKVEPVKVEAAKAEPVKVEEAPKPQAAKTIESPQPVASKTEPAVVAMPVVSVGETPSPDSNAETKPLPTRAKEEPAKAEPAKAEPAKPAAKVEPAKAEPAKAAAKVEPAKAEPAKAAAKVEPVKAEPAKAAAKVEPVKVEPAKKAEPVKAEPAKPAAKVEPSKAAASKPAAKAEPSKAAAPKKRFSGEDLITELFEACADLHFLRDALEGAEFVLSLVMEKLPSEVALVSFFDMGKREFIVARQSGGPRSALALRQPERAAIAYLAMRKRHAVVVTDKAAILQAMDDRMRAVGVEIKSMVVAPVELSGRFLGLIEVVNPLDGHAFNEGDGNALTYIGQQFAEFVATHGVVVDADQIREAASPPPGPRSGAASSKKTR